MSDLTAACAAHAEATTSPGGHEVPSTAAAGRGLVVVAGVAAAAAVTATLVPWLSPLVVGLVFGAIVVNVLAARGIELPWLTAGAALAARRLLRIGVVLLGLRLSFADVVDLGAAGMVVVVAVVTVTFLGTRALARVLGVSPGVGLLVATGFSICGASAVAAISGVARTDEDETAYAVALVTLCGTLSIAVLPAIGALLGLDPVELGTWAGGAVHDVGQVVAIGGAVGDGALEAATVVKLSRVVLLAPLVAGVALLAIRRGGGTSSSPDAAPSRPPVVPLFVGGFMAMIALRSTGWLSAGTLDVVRTVEQVVVTVALVGLGMAVRVDRLRRLGGRPLVLGLAAWVLVGGSALGGTLLVG